MAYTLTQQDEQQFVEFSLDGKFSQDIRKKILYSTATTLRQTGYTRVLIDVVKAEFSPDEPLTGALTLITVLKALGFEPSTRMAFLYQSAGAHRKYFESMAQSEGYSIKYFYERDEALAWLAQK